MTIRKLLLGCAAVAIAGPAFAADLAYPVKAPVVAVIPVFSWTGGYVGGNFGYGSGKGSAPWLSYLDFYYAGFDQYGYGGGTDPSGWFGGVQVGYNYQLDNNVVIGIEADAQFGSLNDTLTYYAGDTSTGTLVEDFGNIETKLDAFGTIRGRLGYAFDRFLPYATAGIAWGQVKMDEQWSGYSGGVFSPALSGAASESKTLWGWTVGGGVEYAFTDNWTVKAEYLYSDLGDITWDNTANTNVDVKLQTVKVGVNYKF